MGLSAPRIIIVPKTATGLGWIWSQGTLQESPHRVAILATCSPPDTVHGMRSYIGSYKVLAHTTQTQDKITWSDELKSTNKCIILPQPDDHLWIVTDAAVKSHGLGTTLSVEIVNHK